MVYCRYVHGSWKTHFKRLRGRGWNEREVTFGNSLAKNTDYLTMSLHRLNLNPRRPPFPPPKNNLLSLPNSPTPSLTHILSTSPYAVQTPNQQPIHPSPPHRQPRSSRVRPICWVVCIGRAKRGVSWYEKGDWVKGGKG